MSFPVLSQAASEDFARRCHAANVVRWRFHQLGKKAVMGALEAIEKANVSLRKLKIACHEPSDNGWDSPLVTPWPRDGKYYILIPPNLLILNGDIDEAERTWLSDIQVGAKVGFMKDAKLYRDPPVSK